jgi:small subunit ribosomal protein S8
MTMTDPVADLLTRLRNANSAYHETVSLPNSKLKTHIAENLKYGPNRERSIVGIKRVSKPGLRVYAKSTEIPKVFGGLGVAILSTSSGLLTDRQATKKGVGGEVLAYVW